MFNLFGDYKTTEEIDLICAVRKLKAHYLLYSGLNEIWEDIILRNTKYLFADWGQKELEDLKEFTTTSEFGLKEVERILRIGFVDGQEQTIEDLTQKYAKVEMMLGHTLVKKNVAEKEVIISAVAFERVRSTEILVKNQKDHIKRYPKKVAELTNVVGRGLVKRSKILKTIEILEGVRHVRLLGASNKREMIKLLKEQNWRDLELGRYLEVASVKKAIIALNKKLLHFQKEMNDEMGSQLQKTNFEGFVSMIELLTAVVGRREEWIDNSHRFDSLFKNEMDQLFELFSSPEAFVNQTIKRMMDIWFSPLKLTFGELDETTSSSLSSPKKRDTAFNYMIALEPSALLSCLMTIVEMGITCMINWDKVIKFTYIYQKVLEDKVTLELQGTAYILAFREAFFIHKTSLLDALFKNLEKYIPLVGKGQLGRLSPKSLIQLRIVLSRLFMQAHLFSFNVPKNKLESAFEELIEAYLDHSLCTSTDMLLAILRTTDAEQTPLDLEGYITQLKEVITVTHEGSHEPWYFFGNGTNFIPGAIDRLKNTIPAFITPDNLRKTATDYITELDKIHPVDFKKLNSEPLQRVERVFQLSVNSGQHNLRVDNAGAVMLNLVVSYTKLWLYFPEFKDKVHSRVAFLFQLFYFIGVARSLPPLSIQFLLSGGFNLNALENEESFPQLENFSDIMLFQGRFNCIRKLFKRLNDSLDEVAIPGIKDKIIITLTELLVQTASRSESKDKTGLQLQRIMKTVFSLSSVNEVAVFDNFSQHIDEISDFLFYNLLLGHTRELQVFAKTGKIKWDELKDPEGVSEYVADVVSSIKNLVSLVARLGSL